MNKEVKSFEQKLERLSEIVSKLEGDTLPLEESMKLYEEGTTLIKELEEELSKAEEKIGSFTEIESK
ncbi:MAG: exodeoxyribonuclease VII small subunit [Bacillota bacterium]|nr:exodeoxyribonuclease VII small subunit [Bacillota bacterium]